MTYDKSPIFENNIFINNTTDVQFRIGSQALCGLRPYQMNLFSGGVLRGQTRYACSYTIDNLVTSICGGPVGILTPPGVMPANHGLVDPLVSDLRLSSTSPLIAAGTNMTDIGAMSADAVFTFSSFLDGRVEFDGGQIVQFENGEITNNTVGKAAAFRFMYTLNLRPVYELRFKGGFSRRPSAVTVWKNRNTPVPPLPDEYAVWDASVNGVQFAKMNSIELPSSGSIRKNAVPKTTPPAPVSGINIAQESSDVVLIWNRHAEPDVARYKIFRAPAATPHLVTQIASLPVDVTQFRDVNQTATSSAYRIVAYDSTGNMSAHVGGNKFYSFSGFDAAVRDTLRVTPEGITVQISNSDYLHGAMITVRNRGHNDSLVVDWYGNVDQNQTGCQSRSANLFGNGAQINNITSPRMGNGFILLNLRSATQEPYLADIEIFNWRNGPGCE
jgi:hypothetical protein